jgi:hypothetical protein
MLINLLVIGHHAVKVKTTVVIMMIALMVEDHLIKHEMLRWRKTQVITKHQVKKV